MTVPAPVRPSAARRTMPQPLEPALREAVRQLDEAAAELLHPEGRMSVWRFLGNALAARKALANHAAACSSPRGPLAHIEESRPRLRSRVQRCLGEHDRMIALLDSLIAGAKAAESLDTAVLRRRTLLCASMASGHGRRVRATVFEWAYRDIGGEAG